MLVWENEFCERVVSHDAVVVCRAKTLKEARRDSEEGNMLDVWIVSWAVRHDVVYVVVTLPPAAAEPAEEVGDENSNAAVNVEVVCDAHVASIVNCEHKLMPEHA